MCMGDKFLFVPTPSSNIHILDIENYSVVKTLNGHYSAVNCVTFNETEQEMYSGGNDRNILIWESNQARSEAYTEHLAGTKRGNVGITPHTVTVDNWSSSDDDDD